MRIRIRATTARVGEGVRRFQVGDPAFASPGFRFGAYAEYICLPVDGHPIKKGSSWVLTD